MVVAPAPQRRLHIGYDPNELAFLHLSRTSRVQAGAAHFAAAPAVDDLPTRVGPAGVHPLITEKPTATPKQVLAALASSREVDPGTASFEAHAHRMEPRPSSPRHPVPWSPVLHQTKHRLAHGHCALRHDRFED